jgi:anti-sigma-K factor RskA
MSPRELDLDCVECVDAAPYVLGALADAERYHEHLATCAVCRAEVAKLQRAVDMLPATVPPIAAPESLRERVLATVRSEAELLRAAGDEADRAPIRASRSRARRLPLWSAGIAIAASIAVAAIVIGGGSSAPERVTSAQIAPAAHGARASLRQAGGRGELIVSNMPQPPVGKIYEVWLSRGAGSPQPTDALFGVTSRGSGSIDIPSSLRGVKEVMVTSEPLGGSSRPTSQPLLRIVLTA